MEFWDDYKHKDSNITYILECIKISNTNQNELPGCDCNTECIIENNCACLLRSGTFYTPTNSSKCIRSYIIREFDMKQGPKPTYECNHNCKCTHATCGNKLVQYGPRKGLKISTFPHKGYGVIANRKISTGNFICEYAGEQLSAAEASRRFERNDKNGGKNYIFCVKENFGDENCVKTFVDPTFYGNIGRYINHSCEPNSTLIPIRTDSEIPMICIFAMKDIKVGEEITFDYGEGDTGFNYNEKLRKKCYCMSKNCKNFLPYDSSV